MPNPLTRRSLLQNVPLAAAALAVGQTAGAQPLLPSAEPMGKEPYKLVTAAELGQIAHQLQEKPGTHSLINSPSLPFTAGITTEEKKAAKEFEYHEGKDHTFQIIEGTTVYEVGGTPESPRNIRPGEWMAPASKGSVPLTLKAGDMLFVPRGTPHRRRTDARVTLLLISTTGNAPPSEPSK